MIKSIPKGMCTVITMLLDMLIISSYVEMLEQQQSQLVAGLQETYCRLLSAQLWPGPPLTEHNGKPLTHDILAGLELLEPKLDGSGEMEVFEEDCQNLQRRLVSDGAPLVGRRGSFSSDSDHDHSHGHGRNSSHSSSHGTPTSTQAQPVFAENWKFETSPSPILQSPQSIPQQPRQTMKPSPLSNDSASHDDFLVSPAWLPGGGLSDVFMRSGFALQTPTIQDNLPTMMANWPHDGSLDIDSGAMTFNPQYANNQFGAYHPQDWMNMNGPMDADFNSFVQVPT